MTQRFLKFAELVGLFGFCVLLVGCDIRNRIPLPQAEVPVMNIPRLLREWNWGGGSCVHASAVMCLRWQGQYERAQYWRRTYAGGESSDGLMRKMNANSIAYATTTSGSVEFLEWCSRTRRGAVIFYYPNHSICFAGYSERDGQEYAVLLDNNRIDNFIWVPKDRFIREWRGFGGFALTPLFNPQPRLSYQPFQS